MTLRGSQRHDRSAKSVTRDERPSRTAEPLLSLPSVKRQDGGNFGSRMTRAVDHEFGSQATELKLSVVEAYLRAFTTALRRKFPELWYIDAFAGTGERAERIPARRGSLLGSTQESIIRYE
jgi:hypothetical protein